jgi:multidrug efflux pump subunit AcrA (membrane-fusion protein)
MLVVLTMPGVADCPAGVITRWYKQAGDRVLRGEPLVEISFTSAAYRIARYDQITDQQGSAYLADPKIAFRLIRTESWVNIINATAVARPMQMVVSADIIGVLREIVGTTGQPIQPGAIIAVFDVETS